MRKQWPLIGLLTVCLFLFACSKDKPNESRGNTVTDIDGNVYKTVTIGTQVWMAENLKVTHYRNGDAIPNVTDSAAWLGLTTGAYCSYNNDISNVTIYGRLYNWYSLVDSRNVAPVGWHMPSDAEWKQLEIYIGMSQTNADLSGGGRSTNEGGKLKEIGTSHWITNVGATNESGFTGLPGGSRGYPFGFRDQGYYCEFWSTTVAHDIHIWNRELRHTDSRIGRYEDFEETAGLSVRCVKD